MAVIRAQRLWIDTRLGDSPEYQLYTVPAGKRAIIRTISVMWSEIPESLTNLEQAWIMATVAGVRHGVFWTWPIPDSTQAITNDPTWQLSKVWNGQLVLHAGDTISAFHVYTTMLVSTFGSGHELLENQ